MNVPPSVPPSGRQPFAALVASLLCACLMPGSAPAAAQDFTVTGNCREGLPHGAYELRGPDGQLRAAGAFNRGKRMGSFLFWTESGARLAQLPYDEDALNGNAAAWYPPAARGRDQVQRMEAGYAQGRLAGTKRTWYATGRDRTELRYDAGSLAAARAFGEGGKPLPEAEARALAVRDEAADARFVATLEALVREHLPRCEPAGDRLEKG
ncbi:MAG: hypothetical protein U1F10_01585 [Burkholderiales bacterium]